MEFDEYKTISGITEEILFKDKASKFLGFAFRVKSKQDVDLKLEQVRAKHPSANHCCYAFRIGYNEPDIIFRANDDGEPSNSAGMPIYGQILSQQLTDILIIVVRYFGGTKLGVSGLINAYKTTADLVIQNSRIVRKTIRQRFVLKFGYEDMNNVMRVIKENDYRIISNHSSLECKLELELRLRDIKSFKSNFEKYYKVKILEMEK